MHRFRLTWRGDLIESHSPVNTFKTVLTIALSYLVFDTALGVLIEYNFNDNAQVQTPLVAIVANVKTFVGLLMTFWFIYALYKTRKRVRETYSIPEQTCTGCEDCMCATFCGCCTGKLKNTIICQPSRQQIKYMLLAMISKVLFCFFLCTCLRFTWNNYSCTNCKAYW